MNKLRLNLYEMTSLQRSNSVETLIIRSGIFSMFCLHQNTQAGTLFWRKHKPLVKYNV